MGLTERHWFEDEEEARRWWEDRGLMPKKEDKMVVYEAIVIGNNYGQYEDYDHFTYSFGLYKSYYSAFKVILNANDQKVFNKCKYDVYYENELRPLEDDIEIPEGCVRALTNRLPLELAKELADDWTKEMAADDNDYYDYGDWNYYFYIKEREVLD